MARESEKSGFRTIVLEWDLITSDVFHALGRAAIRVLLIFMSKRRMKKDITRKQRWVITNNGEIEFTYVEAHGKWGIPRSTFQRALEQYCVERAGGLRMLAAPGASLGTIEAFFAAMIESMSGDAQACLITKTCLTREDGDTAVARKVSQHMRNVEKCFQKAVENSVEKGEVRCDDPKRIARFLNMTVQGVSVLARSGTSKKVLRDLVDVSLSVLR